MTFHLKRSKPELRIKIGMVDAHSARILIVDPDNLQAWQPMDGTGNFGGGTVEKVCAVPITPGVFGGPVEDVTGIVVAAGGGDGQYEVVAVHGFVASLRSFALKRIEIVYFDDVPEKPPGAADQIRSFQDGAKEQTIEARVRTDVPTAQTRTTLGVVDAHSARLLVVDPKNLEHWRPRDGTGNFGGGTYENVCAVPLEPNACGGPVEEVAGVVFGAGGGDGWYKVVAVTGYVAIVDWVTLKKIEIVYFDDEPQD